MEPLEQYEPIQALVKKDIKDALQASQKERQYDKALIPDHRHTGNDSNRVEFGDLSNRKFHVFHSLFGTNMATAANYGVVLIVPFACVLTKVQAVFEVASTSGTLQVTKLTGTTAPASGTTMLSTTISLAGTANTVLTGTLSTLLTSTQLAMGDRIALLGAGTLTNGVGLHVTIELTI